MSDPQKPRKTGYDKLSKALVIGIGGGTGSGKPPSTSLSVRATRALALAFCTRIPITRAGANYF